MIELEREANQRILDDMKELLNKYALEYMNTSAYMTINECVDKLVFVEQYTRLKEIVQVIFMIDKSNDAIVFTLSCKCCDDKQNILVDKNRAIKLEKIKNEIICDKCIEKRRLK